MQLIVINGQDYRAASFNETMAELRKGYRPLTLRFLGTKEQVRLERMVKLFLEADEDRSGALDREELAVVMNAMYKGEKIGRPLKKLQAEVDQLMEIYDTDKSGTLEFNEFVALSCSVNSLCSVEERKQLMKLAQIMQFKMASQA